MGEGLTVDAKFLLQLGESVTALQKAADQLAKQTMWPRYGSCPGTCVTDASGNGIIKLGPVTQGRRWVVHQMVIGGVYWTTSVSGSALVFILPDWSNVDSQPPLVALQDEASGTTPALPSVATYGRGQFVVPSMNNILIMITGGGVGVTYSASCDYVDEPEAS